MNGSHVIRVDAETYAIIDSYREWLERDGLRKVTVGEATRELLVRAAREIERNRLLQKA